MTKSVSTPDKVLTETSASGQEPGRHLPWSERRNWFRARLQRRPLPGIGEDEAEVHFAGMPSHYWERVDESDLAWGLETIHGFLQAIATPESSAMKPFASWRHEPSSNCTRVMLCTWDRHSLLAKCAACFSAVNLNILQADVYTRSDNIVLDVFRVCDSTNPSPASPVRLQELTFLLEGALGDPPRFASVWACSRHKLMAAAPWIRHRISFDNDSAAGFTIVRVEASDRLGLLYDILQVLTDDRLNVTQACIATERGVARDLIHITDAQGQKILDRTRLEELRRSLDAALTIAT